MSETVKPEILCPSFASTARNEPTVPHNELTPTASEEFALKLSLRKKTDNNLIEDDCIAVCDKAKKIGGALTDTSFKLLRFGKDNKHVV